MLNNGMVLRRKTNRELADFLCKVITDCDVCPVGKHCDTSKYTQCDDVMYEWLREEIETEENNE